MWLAMLAAGLASYLLRVLPLFALGRLELPERVSTALHHAATGAMAVMLVTAGAHAAGVGGSAATDGGAGASVPPVGRALGVAMAVGLGLLLGRSGRPMPVVVLASLLGYVGVTSTSLVVVALLR